MNFVPNFNEYYKTHWPYNADEGVGIELTQYPTDIFKFLDILHQQGCSPVAARRILEALKENDIKCTTLMSHLNFNHIGNALKDIGVCLKIIPPKTSDKLKTALLDKEAFNLSQYEQYNINRFSHDDKEEIIKRKSIFQQSMINNPHHLGPFDSNWTIAKEHMRISNKTKSRKKNT